MGFASKAISVFFRLVELGSAIIVAGLVGRYLSYIHDAHVNAGSRIIYTIVVAGISILASLVLIIPWRYSFFAFPLDAILFILWIVSFGLLVNLVGSRGCNSRWYWTNWGYYWGGFWRTVPVVDSSAAVVNRYGCSRWDTALAFAFIGGIFWLLSAALGLYNCIRRDRDRPELASTDVSNARTEDVRMLTWSQGNEQPMEATQKWESIKRHLVQYGKRETPSSF